ncbi:MAG: hypothetical protein JXB36_12975 [Gammaproteobacteria bacterium]|nr:hypothetical protein [Gammaproteobacteria bacterium]
MNSIADWMQTTWINALALNYAWTWPTLETLHFIGMSLLIGAIIIMDLRLIGVQRVIPSVSVHTLLPIAFIGFGINLLTGIIFLFGDPNRYFINISFQIKMVLVLLAGLNALLYAVKVAPAMANAGPHDPTPGLAKAVGAASLLLWAGVLCFGRLIPYLGTG